MKNLLQTFNAHPASVGESYWQHMGTAFSFGLTMLLTAFACFVHAVLPFLFVKTGSEVITRLNRRMVTHRSRIGHPCDRQAE
jgi:Family of unknown function (DUF6356)